MDFRNEKSSPSYLLGDTLAQNIDFFIKKNSNGLYVLIGR